MGGVHSEPNQAGCIAWQNSNPTKECTWTEGCFQYWISKKGDQPTSAFVCGGVGSSDPSSQSHRKSKCDNNNTLILIGIGLLILALICSKKR